MKYSAFRRCSSCSVTGGARRSLGRNRPHFRQRVCLTSAVLVSCSPSCRLVFALSHSSFWPVGARSTLGRPFQFHVPPPRSPISRYAAPPLAGSVYVMSIRQSSARAARQHAAYSTLQALGWFANTHSRVTSAVQPSCRRRATGRPTIATTQIYVTLARTKVHADYAKYSPVATMGLIRIRD